MVVSALWADVGFTASSSSMSENLVRPIMRSCSLVDNMSQPATSCKYFCTITPSTGEDGILGTPDRRHGVRRLRSWVLRAIDKNHNEITVVEIAKTMHFIGHGNGIAQPSH